MTPTEHLTAHFTLEEMIQSQAASRMGIDNSPSDLVLSNLLKVCKALEKIREHYGKPMHIGSGYRCPQLNTAVGGSKNSYHMLGLAADFNITGRTCTNKEIVTWMKDNLENYDQIIYEFGESGWIHLALPDGCPGRKMVMSALKSSTGVCYVAGLV